MATAAFTAYKCTGVNAATETDSVKNPCFLNSDEHSTDTGAHRVGVPDPVSSPNYSYEVYLRLKCITAPNNDCDNFKFWGPSEQPDYMDTPGNKLTIMVATTATGATPTDNASTVATTVQHTNYNGPDPGSHLAIGVVPVDDVIDAVGEYTDYIVFQLKVEDGAQRGEMATLPFYIEYDEA